MFNQIIDAMKFKFFLLMMVLSIVPVTRYVYASGIMDLFYKEEMVLPDGLDRIDLYGDLMRGLSPDAIEAGVGNDAVYIQFNQDFGHVIVSLYNDNGGLVYNSVINTSVQQLVIIPINNNNTSYYLELNNASGYAEGIVEL